MSMDESVTAIFENFQKDLAVEQEKREEIRSIVKDLDQAARQITTILQSVHKPGGLRKVSSLIDQAKSVLENSVQKLHLKLADTVPSTEFYRYHDHWKFATQRLVFVVCFIEYLTSDRLLLWSEAADNLYLTTDRSVDNLYLDLEDYLHGLISLSNELSRLAVNAVTAADYQRPLRISSFMADLESGFRLLNLKNDNLRKRFDSIKYDMKKVEEVVYDISIRGLSTSQPDTLPEEDGASTVTQQPPATD